MVLHDWTLIFLEEWFLLLVVYRVDFSIFVTARTYHAHFYKLNPLSSENVKSQTLPKKKSGSTHNPHSNHHIRRTNVTTVSYHDEFNTVDKNSRNYFRIIVFAARC